MKHETRRFENMLEEIKQNDLKFLSEIFSSAVVFAVDKNRKITFWSKGAEQILGFPSEKVIGENCLTGNRCQQCLKGCGISEYGQVDGYSINLLDVAGKAIAFKKYAIAFYDDAKEFNGGVEVLIPSETNQKYEAKTDLVNENTFHGLVSSDPAMQEIFKLVLRVAETDVNVLVRGESGTGKELIARAIHDESPRKNKSFMALNCASLNANLLESELFGHVKGAFTDAYRNHIGLVSRAEGGTLFLDEVAEIPLDIQAKLLRVIQEREYSPVGTNDIIKADIRILAATHQSLRKLVLEGKFREDLMYRLRVVPLFLPPLRERKNDIPLLLNHFIKDFDKKGMKNISSFHPDTMRLLLNYHWPGNVRELINVIEYANAVSRTSIVTINDLPPEFLESKNTIDFKSDDLSINSEKKKIKDALIESDGDLGLAAKLLGMSRTTLWRKRKKYL